MSLLCYNTLSTGFKTNILSPDGIFTLTPMLHPTANVLIRLVKILWEMLWKRMAQSTEEQWPFCSDSLFCNGHQYYHEWEYCYFVCFRNVSQADIPALKIRGERNTAAPPNMAPSQVNRVHLPERGRAWGRHFKKTYLFSAGPSGQLKKCVRPDADWEWVIRACVEPTT